VAGRSSQQQGLEFEENFHELIGRLLSNDLGFEVLENRIQPAGAQYGKDIQTRWRDGAGTDVFWQFECKSHVNRSLSRREIADKLFDLMRSAHDIDVWCLVLAAVEPGAWIDETLAWAKSNLDLPFEIEIISPSQHDIRRLFACEPELFAKQYGDESDRQPSGEDRIAAISEFEGMLNAATNSARERRVASWQVVAPERMAFEDDPESAAAYLRGLRSTAPWEAVFNGWAVWRGSSVSPLVNRILSSTAGFDFAWLVAAGGEGKSTVLRQVAWVIAAEHPDWIVLWTEAAMRDGDAEIPVELIESVGERDVLLCVDGSDGLTGADRLHANAERLARSGKRVFVLFADRGTVWNRSRLPGRLRRGLRNVERRIELEPLSDEEVEGLIEKLEGRQLLESSSPETAREALGRRDGGDPEATPWLLPTLMQLTDPQGRGFEGILASVVADLKKEPSMGPLLLLLGASLAQGAGRSLPSDLGERLVREEGGLTTSLEVLTAELETQLGASSAAMGLEERPGSLITHHQVIAEGFVKVAATNSDYRQRFLDACDALPLTVAEDIDQEVLIPKPRFLLLDSILRFLLDLEPRQYEAADRFLRSLITLDPRQFPALTRLGDCDANWLRDEIRANKPNQDRIEWLQESARSAYRSALQVARDVLGDKELRPRPYADSELDEEEQIISHGWGVLEDTIGQRNRDRSVLKRAVLLFLRSIQNRGLTTLSLPLIHMGELNRAAQATAAFASVARDERSQIHVRNQKRLLTSCGQAVPDVGIEILDELLADLVLNLLLESWAEMALFDSYEEHVETLRDILTQGKTLIKHHDLIDRAVMQLTAD
jgi:hypothetical protein